MCAKYASAKVVLNVHPRMAQDGPEGLPSPAVDVGGPGTYFEGLGGGGGLTGAGPMARIEAKYFLHHEHDHSLSSREAFLLAGFRQHPGSDLPAYAVGRLRDMHGPPPVALTVES
jgi:hypothetical protein